MTSGGSLNIPPTLRISPAERIIPFVETLTDGQGFNKKVARYSQ